MPTRPLFILCLAIGCADEPETAPVEVVVPGAISVAPETLDFGSRELLSEATSWLTITNTGDGTLQVFDVTFADDAQRPHWSLEGGLSGFLEPGDETSLTVDAHPQTLDNPNTGILISSDDPDFPQVSVPLTIEVFALPELRVDPPEVLEMSSVPLGDSSTADIIIANDGYADLQVTEVSIDEDGPFAIEIDATATTVRSRTEDGLIRVRFTPVAAGSFTKTLTIQTDDPGAPTWSLFVQGTATD